MWTDVNNLNARVKAVIVMNKKREEVCLQRFGSPPEPIVTHLGTWIASTEYYAENIEQVKEIVNSFSANGILVQKAKEAVNDENNETVSASLVKIKRDYSGLTTIIKKMESSKYSIREAHSDINKLDFKEDSASVMPYMAKRMNKNSDMSAIMELSRPADSPAVCMGWQCQPTSASVEHSFSTLNKLLAKDRIFYKILLSSTWFCITIQHSSTYK